MVDRIEGAVDEVWPADKFDVLDGDFREVEFRATGGAAILMASRHPRILIEGPAGTGKSRACLEKLDFLCTNNPGIRVLILRKTRVSLNESALITLEDKVFGKGHPCLDRDIGKESRTGYDYPNGARIVLGGMDNPTRLFSTEYDIIYVNEANELSQDEIESLNRALRNGVLSYQQLMMDCNPDTEFHHLNQACNRGAIYRILSRHSDNPSVTPEYLERLAALTGVRRERLFLGRWVSAEGQVLEEWDSNIHVVPRGTIPRMKWHFGAIDWGFRAPGCFQVWGVCSEGSLYRLREYYHTEKPIDWWADRVQEEHKKHKLCRIACDPAEPRSIDLLNDRLGFHRNRDVHKLAIKADNDMAAGIDTLRSYLRDPVTKKPRMFFVADALRGRDPRLVERASPTCFEEEVASWIWLATRDGRQVKEMPDPSCSDHAIDAARYASMFAWKRDFSSPVQKNSYDEGSFGAMLKHDDVLSKMKY